MSAMLWPRCLAAGLCAELAGQLDAGLPGKQICHILLVGGGAGSKGSCHHQRPQVPIYWNWFPLRIIYFASVSSGFSQRKHLLDDDDSEFSDRRLTKFFSLLITPNTIQILFFHHLIIEDPRKTN